MYELFYCIEVNVIALFLLAWIVFKHKSTSDEQTLNILFFNAAVSLFILLALESVQKFFSYPSASKKIITTNYIVSALYYAMSGFGACQWFAYCTYRCVGVKSEKNWIRIIIYGAATILAILSFVSPLSGSIFYIDSMNTLRHGTMFAVQPVVVYGIFTAASFVALISIFKIKEFTRRENIVSFVAFIVLPLLGGGLHLVFPQARVVWQLLSISMMLIYCEVQFSYISVDALTGLNNRRSFSSKMKQISSVPENSERYYLFMIDVNLFKHINDNFGHSVGDSALVEISNILRKQLGTTSAFICRYGGDEFVVVYACSDKEAAELRLSLYRTLEERNKGPSVQYPLSVSVGYAKLRGTGPDAVADVLSRADFMLYDEKSAMHEALHRALQKQKKRP